MGKYSDILLTADFDRTLTARDSTIPQRNLDAIRYFISQGGSFTVNTGRSLPMFHRFLDRVPVNAPLLLYNGSAAYDTRREEFLFFSPIAMDQGETIRRIQALSQGLILEIQGRDRHYIFSPDPTYEAFYREAGCPSGVTKPETDVGPFIKLSIFGPLYSVTVAHLFQGSEEEIRYYDRVEAALRAEYGDRLTVLRVAPRIIDIHAPGVSKGNAALELKEKLGKKLLVCAGDEQNDVSMLDAADYAFCPADAAVADRYPNVCCCDDGAVADIIYKKIPDILAQRS